jgi:putative transposase
MASTRRFTGDNPKICVLVLMGVDDAGKKHLIALEDGVRESTQSWREVLLGAKARGMNAAKLATGDGAMGFWAELSEVFASATHQRCWMHKSGNVMNYLPQSTRAKAKVDLHQIWMAGGRQEAEEAMTLFEEKYGAKYPRAVECLTKDGASLLAFYDFPPRALVTHSHHQPNRVHLRDAAPPHQTRQGCLLQRERTGHGVAVGARGTEALEPHHRS